MRGVRATLARSLLGKDEFSYQLHGQLVIYARAYRSEVKVLLLLLPLLLLPFLFLSLLLLFLYASIGILTYHERGIPTHPCPSPDPNS